MAISHVIRGDGHISNTHRQILIYEALDAPVRCLRICRPCLGLTQQVEQAHGATSLEEFRSQGYFPEALAITRPAGMVSPVEGKEIMDLGEIIGHFDLSRVSVAPRSSTVSN